MRATVEQMQVSSARVCPEPQAPCVEPLEFLVPVLTVHAVESQTLFSSQISTYTPLRLNDTSNSFTHSKPTMRETMLTSICIPLARICLFPIQLCTASETPSPHTPHTPTPQPFYPTPLTGPNQQVVLSSVVSLCFYQFNASICGRYFTEISKQVLNRSCPWEASVSLLL